MGEDELLGTLAYGQQFVLQIIGKEVLPSDDSLEFVFFAQLGESCLRDTMLRCNFRFDQSAMFLSNGGKFAHRCHVICTYDIILIVKL